MRDESRPSQFDPGTEPVDSKTKLEVLAAQCNGYYQTVLTLATGFLGGSLLFIEKIAPKPVHWTLWLLGAGWVALLYAVWNIAEVRRTNMESMRLALRCEFDKARPIDVRARRLCHIGLWATITGMVLISTYGLTNLALPRKEKPTMSKAQDTKRSDSGTPLSISGGDAGPKRPAPTSTPESATSPAKPSGGNGGDSANSQ